MKRIVDFLAPAGIAVALIRLVAYYAGKTMPGKLEIYLIVGAALVLAHILLRWESIVRAVGGRQLRYGTNMLALIVVVLAILGGINWIGTQHIIRWDLTKSKRYSLSDQTKKVIQGLKDDVKITYFQRVGNPGMEQARDRLRSYEALSAKLKIEFVDPVAKPGRAQALDVRGPWPVIIVEKEGKRERITGDGEEEVTNAILKVTRSGKKTVCFVEGEGEKALDDSAERGLSQVKTALGKSLYETKKVVLVREPKVPDDCTVVVVAGPEKDLLAPAIDAIRSFVKGGGKALIMVEPEMKDAYPNLTGLLKEWNVEAGKDVVVDASPVGQLVGTGPLTPVVMEYPSHPITKDFRVMTVFHTARSMKAMSGYKEGVTTQDLLKTSPQSWAESDLSLKEPVEPNPGKDTMGPISLGVTVTVRGTPPPAPSPNPSPEPAEKAEPPKAPEGRVVALGDSDFASNQLLGFQGNKDFFLNTVAWLAQDVDLISIRPKEADDQSLLLNRTQRLVIGLVSLIVLPGLWVLVGIGVWWRRR
jgi:ABC-type uncharacterized transport system involved in gliding motility auxiliary subunit